MIKLTNDKLTISIASPFSVYNGPRFDGSGIITDITFDKHSFCELEQREPNKGSGGTGFCNEFGIDKPIDYETTTVGQDFPKIGVGLVTKESKEDYDFFAPAPVKACKYEEEINEESYKVTTLINDDKDYSITLTKMISLKGNKLIIDYKLENNGSRVIHTNEYNHNFIGINHDNIGKDYKLTWFNLSGIEKVVGDFSIVESDRSFVINWDKEPNGDFYATMTLGETINPCNWELVNSKHQVGVRECSSFPISKIAMWGFNHVVCPEVFIDINLEPNKTMTWTRVYEFFEM